MEFYEIYRGDTPPSTSMAKPTPIGKTEGEKPAERLQRLQTQAALTNKQMAELMGFKEEWAEKVTLGRMPVHGSVFAFMELYVRVKHLL